MTSLPTIVEADAEILLDRHRNLLVELTDAHILLTGGTGFVGRWLTAALVHAINRLGLRCRLTILTRDPARCLQAAAWYSHPAIRLVACDIRMLAPGSAGDVSHVIHAAAEVSSSGHPLLGLDTAMRGTSAVLDALPQAARFLLVSSGGIYGSADCPRDGIPETCCSAHDPLDPRLSYQHGKRASESLCAAGRAAGRLSHLSVARIFAVLGPWLPAGRGFAAADLLQDANAGRSLCIRGDGQAVRSYLYAGDLVGWLWTILLRGSDGAAYNVGSDRTVSIAELAETISIRHPAKPRVEILGKAEPGRAAQRYFPNIAKARTELGLAPWTGLETAVDRTLAFSMSAP